MPPRRIIVTGEPEPSPREPDATCDGCGATGTVGQATRFTSPRTVRRFCRACWPAARRRLAAAWGAEMDARAERLGRGEASGGDAPPGFSFRSRAWDDAVEFLERIEAAGAGGEPGPTRADLAALAAQIRSLAPEMDGPMPPAVADFLRRFDPPAG